MSAGPHRRNDSATHHEHVDGVANVDLRKNKLVGCEREEGERERARGREEREGIEWGREREGEKRGRGRSEREGATASADGHRLTRKKTLLSTYTIVCSLFASDIITNFFPCINISVFLTFDNVETYTPKFDPEIVTEPPAVGTVGLMLLNEGTAGTHEQTEREEKRDSRMRKESRGGWGGSAMLRLLT